MKSLLKSAILGAGALMLAACAGGPKDGEYTLELLTTNDVHGSYFDQSYVDDQQKNSMFAVNWYVDSVRNAAGKENVILIDAGDHLQGDNAAYYFNYVDTRTEHVWSRIMDYMKYDAVVVGNHDVETAHPVYDRITKELSSHKIPYLAGNAVRNDNGEPYWKKYTTFRKNGIKVLVIGYTNANMAAWLNESVWSGMKFESIVSMVQQDVDAIVAKEKPQVVIVATHTGTGSGNGEVLESQGMDILKEIKGVDFLLCAHDHRATTVMNGNTCLVNAGSHARNLGHGTITLVIKDGKVVDKKLSADLINVDAAKADPAMREAFKSDYEAVKAFTLQEVGALKSDFVMSDALFGMSDYMNFLHTVCLEATGAQICFAAPLTTNGVIEAGTLIYNDLFTLYRYENQLYTVKFKGSEIKNYLEYSYNSWIVTATKPTDHVLNIVGRDDPRTGMTGWSFRGATYNFDSAAGIRYTVDVTKPYGERVSIECLADGTPFDMDGEYTVAMTSYRASGGGDIMPKGAGIDAETAETRTIDKQKEIRELMYDYMQKHGAIDAAECSNEAVIGHWEFVPSTIVEPALAADKALVTRPYRAPGQAAAK